MMEKMLRPLKNSRSIKLYSFGNPIVRYKKKKKKKKKERIEIAIKKWLPLVDRKSNGEAFVRLIAIQESVEIMKGADWSIVRNNTVHRRRLDRFPHGGSRFTAQFSQLPQIAKTPLAAACSARTFACVNLLSFHHLSFPTYHEDVISALYPSIHPIIFDQFCSVCETTRFMQTEIFLPF